MTPAARPQHVDIVEVGPRDGLQNDPSRLSIEDRIALVRRLAQTGLNRIEAVSFVREDRVPQMAGAEAVLAGLGDLHDVSLSGLVLNERGFDRARDTILREVTFVAVASETFSRRNQGSSVADNIAVWRRIAPRAAAAGLHRCFMIAVAFGCPFEGEVPLEQLVTLAREAADAGIDELALADTIGVAVPQDVEDRFAAVAGAAPGIRLRAHFHDTRGTGLANANAAMRCGVGTLDASVGGLGGCPFAPGASGNIATEDLAYVLDRTGAAYAGSAAAFRQTTAWLEGVMSDRRLPSRTAHLTPFPATRA